jgi:sporulation protein YlmC with PRC-barrel domain
MQSDASMRKGIFMAQENDGGAYLVKLDDFEGELEEHWQDARGLEILDKHGEEVGTVENLYIYEEAQAVHLLQAEIEGRHLLIPVDAITSVQEDGVNVEQPKNVIVESPEHDSEEVPDRETSRAAHAHYGYPDLLVWGGEE